MAKKMTIKDLARIAGVDHSTVSRALNDSPRVHPDTKMRIKRLAEEHDFEFNAIGRSLSRGKSGNIAVIHAGDWDGFGTSQYFNLLFSSLRRTLESYQLDALILEAYNPTNGESNIRRLIRQNKVDGFILVDSHIRKADLQQIKKHSLPVIQLHARPAHYQSDQMDHFFTDNYRGGWLAAEHLVEKGCRRIINMPACMKPIGEFSDRLSGYRDLLTARGISLADESVIYTECSYQAAYLAVYEQQERFRKADGLFCQADVIAFGAMSALKELGIIPPEDLLVVGFDDTPLCEITRPTITSVHQPVEQLADLACRRIADCVNGHKRTGLEQKILEPTLVERGSTHIRTEG